MRTGPGPLGAGEAPGGRDNTTRDGGGGGTGVGPLAPGAVTHEDGAEPGGATESRGIPEPVDGGKAGSGGEGEPTDGRRH